MNGEVDVCDAARRARGEARAALAVRVVPLGGENEDLSGATSPEARLAMMWPLALTAWGLAAGSLPTYDRAHLPVTVTRVT
ncbi:hypothetical protein [Truepera radiovictrix]|uniref:Uncharacterized protein n=1 Tax=Truepera radiovictrix (strain DSM 17093 / CIP 108686 / LMG 22925 / RQ-24) TaxID=649638 RepID=D7CQ89_TRURR|nr:hypothetical protein [Truepera radiovictrix]ADI14873.1 hypothetical protein Trad_1755 [Truepera radiovictrix DSM 17093]WMT56576.1 hypothetical protein RCV51_11245 [Truepera radiovictrix]